MVVDNLCTLSNVPNTSIYQLACSSRDATTWHPNQVHLPILNILHFILSVWGEEEVPCNLTQVVSNTPKGTLVYGETITTFYEFA